MTRLATMQDNAGLDIDILFFVTRDRQSDAKMCFVLFKGGLIALIAKSLEWDGCDHQQSYYLPRMGANVCSFQIDKDVLL